MYSCFASVWEGGFSLFFFFKCQMTWPKKILITLRSTCMYVPRVRRGVEFGGDIIPCMMAIGFNLT